MQNETQNWMNLTTSKEAYEWFTKEYLPQLVKIQQASECIILEFAYLLDLCKGGVKLLYVSHSLQTIARSHNFLNHGMV